MPNFSEEEFRQMALNSSISMSEIARYFSKNRQWLYDEAIRMGIELPRRSHAHPCSTRKPKTDKEIDGFKYDWGIMDKEDLISKYETKYPTLKSWAAEFDARKSLFVNSRDWGRVTKIA